MPDEGPRPPPASQARHEPLAGATDLTRAERSWGRLLTRLGPEPFQSWEHGRSWKDGDVYLVVEQSPDLIGDRHERRSPGLNHPYAGGGPVRTLAASLRVARGTGSLISR